MGKSQAQLAALAARASKTPAGSTPAVASPQTPATADAASPASSSVGSGVYPLTVINMPLPGDSTRWVTQTRGLSSDVVAMYTDVDVMRSTARSSSSTETSASSGSGTPTPGNAPSTCSPGEAVVTPPPPRQFRLTRAPGQSLDSWQVSVDGDTISAQLGTMTWNAFIQKFKPTKAELDLLEAQRQTMVEQITAAISVALSQMMPSAPQPTPLGTAAAPGCLGSAALQIATAPLKRTSVSQCAADLLAHPHFTTPTTTSQPPDASVASSVDASLDLKRKLGSGDDDDDQKLSQCQQAQRLKSCHGQSSQMPQAVMVPLAQPLSMLQPIQPTRPFLPAQTLVSLPPPQRTQPTQSTHSIRTIHQAVSGCAETAHARRPHALPLPQLPSTQVNRDHLRSTLTLPPSVQPLPEAAEASARPRAPVP